MRSLFLRSLAVGAVALGVGGPALAAFPFVENFNQNAANWVNSTSTALVDYVPSGGPDGGPHVSSTLLFDPPPDPRGGSPATIVFRAQEEFMSSNEKYTGNWLAAGIKEVTAFVRHNAPFAIAYNVRFADPGNSPGASYGLPAVPPNTWTKLTIDVTPTSPQLLTTGAGTHATIFDNIGHIQFSAVEPAGWTAQTVTFDLDRVTVAVPEPATLALAGAALAGVAVLARRRRHVARGRLTARD